MMERTGRRGGDKKTAKQLIDKKSETSEKENRQQVQPMWRFKADQGKRRNSGARWVETGVCT